MTSDVPSARVIRLSSSRRHHHHHHHPVHHGKSGGREGVDPHSPPGPASHTGQQEELNSNCDPSAEGAERRVRAGRERWRTDWWATTVRLSAGLPALTPRQAPPAPSFPLQWSPQCPASLRALLGEITGQTTEKSLSCGHISPGSSRAQ